MKTCLAESCTRLVRTEPPFCYWHWGLLPSQLKIGIMDMYDAQAVRHSRPTIAYLERLADAVKIIAATEKFTLDMQNQS